MKKPIEQLRGTGVALITPFTSKGEVDHKVLAMHVRHLLNKGVDYLVPLGTTGESVTLSRAEKVAILKTVVETNKGKVPVVLGLGGNNTADIIENLHSLEMKGVSAILSVSPYYNKPSQAGILQHYKMICDACMLPLILYNVPGRTGSNMSVETTLAIAEACPNVIGIKEACGSVDQVMQIIQYKPKDFLVISGDDNLTLPYIAAGADGVISVLANAYPSEYANMVRAALKGDFVKARKLHYSLLPLIPLLFQEGSPSGVKSALKHLGTGNQAVRLPLVPVSKDLDKKIAGFVRKYR